MWKLLLQVCLLLAAAVKACWPAMVSSLTMAGQQASGDGGVSHKRLSICHHIAMLSPNLPDVQLPDRGHRTPALTLHAGHRVQRLRRWALGLEWELVLTVAPLSAKLERTRGSVSRLQVQHRADALKSDWAWHGSFRPCT